MILLLFGLLPTSNKIQCEMVKVFAFEYSCVNSLLWFLQTCFGEAIGSRVNVCL